MADYYTRNSRTASPRLPVTIELPTEYTVKIFGTETVKANFAALSAEMVETIVMEGALRMLNDGAGGKDKTDAERAAGMRKRLDSWANGNFRIVERGDSTVTLMREALKARIEAATGKTLTDAGFWKAQSDYVTAAGGAVPEKGKAIKLDLVIESIAKVTGADAAAMTATLEAEADALAAERAKALASIDVTGIKLF